MPAWGDTRPPRRPPGGGNEKGGDQVYAAEGSSFYSERVTGGGRAFPSQTDTLCAEGAPIYLPTRRSYPPLKIQVLLSSSSGGKTSAIFSMLTGLSPTKRAAFSYQPGVAFTTKRADISYQTGGPCEAIHYQVGGVVMSLLKQRAEAKEGTIGFACPVPRSLLNGRDGRFGSLPNGRVSSPIPT